MYIRINRLEYSSILYQPNSLVVAKNYQFLFWNYRLICDLCCLMVRRYELLRGYFIL